MADYNCSIYIPKEKFGAVTFFLYMRNIKYITRQSSDGTIEISTEEKFAKTLDRLAKRCYN